MLTKLLPPRLQSIPNQLTLFRLLIIPLLLVLYPLNVHFLNIFCALAFMAGAISDYLDGYFARRYDQVTTFGALFDHVADKLLTISAVVLLVGSGAIYSWLGALIIGRDMAVNGMRLVAAEQGMTIPVHMLGKIKTVVLSGAIFCLFINSTVFEIDFRMIGSVLIWITLLISYISAWFYAVNFWTILEKNENI